MEVAPVPTLFYSTGFVDIPLSLLNMTLTRYSEAWMVALFAAAALFVLALVVDAGLVVVLFGKEDSGFTWPLRFLRGASHFIGVSRRWGGGGYDGRGKGKGDCYRDALKAEKDTKVASRGADWTSSKHRSQRMHSLSSGQSITPGNGPAGSWEVLKVALKSDLYEWLGQGQFPHRRASRIWGRVAAAEAMAAEDYCYPSLSKGGDPLGLLWAPCVCTRRTNPPSWRVGLSRKWWRQSPIGAIRNDANDGDAVTHGGCLSGLMSCRGWGDAVTHTNPTVWWHFPSRHRPEQTALSPNT